MQEVTERQQISAEQLTCPKLNKARLVCIDPKCEESALICFQDSCDVCTSKHKRCESYRVNVLLAKILAKKQNLTEEIKQGIKIMEKAYDDAIDRLSKDKDFVMSQTNMFGYNQYEVDFLTLIKDGLSSQITGKLTSKVFSQIPNKKQWLASSQQIEKYWKKKNKVFCEIFDKFKEITRYNVPFLDSKITDEADKILDFFGEQYNVLGFELLYRASQNGFSAHGFHGKCDGVPNTLVIIKTQHGRIIGGFAPVAWSCSGNYTRDSKTFLFSISNNEKYPCIQPEYSTYCNMGYGPSFGGGHDIYICDNANTQRNSYFNFPNSFNNGKYVNGDMSYQAFCGSTNGDYNSMIQQWEVFKVQFI